MDPYLALVGPSADETHLVRNLKASFSNWCLSLFNQRRSLSFFHTLRHKSDIEEMKTMKKTYTYKLLCKK